MAVIQVTIPNSMSGRMSFEQEVSSILASGYDTQFIDESGNEQNIIYIGIFGGSDGAIKSRTASQVDADAAVKTIISGGYIKHPMSYIYATGTDASLGIRARVELP